jgi:2-amino-4-hydroxy-6-hydroxymethyldihydropteridine diphosphokinase
VIALRFEDWEGTYREILAEFGFSAKDDEDAARLLAQTLGAPPFNPAAVWAALRGEIQGRDVIVLGAGDEAPSQLKRLPRASVLVAADGATTAALEGGRVPNLIVTDLDGNVEDEILAVRKGAYVAIHAHGDNKADVRRYVPQFDPDRVAGTCQCRPVGPLENFGGFTDGDRACFIAHGLGAIFPAASAATRGASIPRRSRENWPGAVGSSTSLPATGPLSVSRRLDLLVHPLGVRRNDGDIQ